MQMLYDYMCLSVSVFMCVLRQRNQNLVYLICFGYYVCPLYCFKILS